MFHDAKHEAEINTQVVGLTRPTSDSAKSLVVEDDDSADGEWQVSWKIEQHSVT